MMFFHPITKHVIPHVAHEQIQLLTCVIGGSLYVFHAPSMAI